MTKKHLLQGEYQVPISDWDDYYVTNYGRVFSNKKNITYKTEDGRIYKARIFKQLKPYLSNGYYKVTLSNGSKRDKIYIHHLVYKNLVGKYDTSHWKINHINKNKLDNRLENLKLVPATSVEKILFQTRFQALLEEY